MPQKDSAEKAVRDIRRKTRRKFSAEEKSGLAVYRTERSTGRGGFPAAGLIFDLTERLPIRPTENAP